MIQSSVSLNEHSEEIDLSEAMRSLRRYWRKIAIFTLAGTIAAVLYVLFSTPQFAINGRLYLGDARANAPVGAVGPDFSNLSNQPSVSDVDTQIELLKSKGLVEQAILQSGLNVQVKTADTPALLFWNWALLYHRNTSAFAPQPGDLRAVNAVFDNPPSGQISLAVVMGDNGHYQISKDGGWFAASTPVLSGILGQPAAGGGLSLVLKPAIDGAVPASGSQFVLKVSSAEAVADALRASGDLDVLNGGVQNLSNPTKIADLLYTGANPYGGQLFLAQLMNNFVAAQTSWNDQAAATTDDFIAGQLVRIHASLVNADQKLADYQSQTGILDVPETAKAVIGQLSQYETQRTSIQLQQEALQQLSTELAHPTSPLNPYLVSETGDPVLTQLTGNLADAEVKLQALQVQFTGTAPDLQIQQASVATTETAITTLVNNDLTMANRNLQNINGMITQFNAQLKNMPTESLEVIALTRSSDTFGQIYQVLLQKQEDAEVSKAATASNTRIVTAAELPLQAATPKPLITLAIGFFAGLFGGAAVILGQLMLSGRFHSDEEIRRLVPLPVYGLIPLDSTIEATPKLLSANLQSPFSEALRLLRSNLYRSATGQGARVVLLTSADVDDGKTTISVNLAKMLADDGKRVILVDADLHVGRLHEALRVDPSHGLTQWLTTKAKPWFQSVPGQRFMMLPAGVLPPNPSELLNDPFFADIIATLRAEFEYVIIDSPPLPAVSDGIALGQQADIILSVVMIDHTVRRAFAVHSEMLSRLDRRQGIIINGVAANSYGYGYASKNAAPPGMFHRARKILGLPG